jgi:hypothetical protein
MSTWFTAVGRIVQIETIPDTGYRNALVELEEGPHSEEASSSRTFYVSFWGNLLESGRTYVLMGTGRLCSNEESVQPKVRSLTIPSYHIVLQNW